MDGHRHVDAMNDPSLDREIESLLATEPSPEFVARVRARVANEPEPGGWRLPFMFSTAGAVAVVIVAVIAWPSREPVPSGDTRVQSPHVAEAIETATSRGPLAPLQPVQGQPARARVVAVAASPDRAIEIDLPDVVIAENEVKAYTTLVSSIRRSRFDAAVPAAPYPNTPLEVKELPPAEPLEIEPIL